MTIDEQKSVELQRDSKGRFTTGRWKPGESGNLKGRPLDKKYISEALKDLLANNPDLLKEVVESILKEVKRGNVQAFKELTDRTEGKVADKIEGTENPVTIILRPARDRDGT